MFSRAVLEGWLYLARIFHRRVVARGGPALVAQRCTLLYRRIVFGRLSPEPRLPNSPSAYNRHAFRFWAVATYEISVLALALLAGNATAATPLVIGHEADGQLEVFKLDDTGRLYHRWRKPSNGAWSSWSSLGGTLAPGFVVATDADGKMELFGVSQVTLSLENIQQITTNGLSWTPWANLGGTLEPAVAAAAAADGHLEVFAVDAVTHEAKHVRQATNGWSAWAGLGGTMQVGLVVGKNIDGRLELFGLRATDGLLMHCWQWQPNGTNWSAWTSLAGAVQPGFAIGTNSIGQLELFGVDRSDGLLKRICQKTAGSTNWSAWEVFGQGLKPQLTVGQCGDRRLEVFGIDVTNSLLLHRWELYVDGRDQWSAWDSMGEKSTTPPVVTANEDGNLEVFAPDLRNPNLIHYRRQISSASDWLEWSTLDQPVFNYASRLWQVDEGLPNNVVQAIAQTWDGYLWVGTRDGLGRFDGVQFTTFNSLNTPALKNSSITALCAGADGALWIGTDGGGLLRLRGGGLSAFGKTNGLAGDNVRVIYEDREGTLWVGTTTGLSRFKNGVFNRFTVKGRLVSDDVRYLSQDRDGNLWIATSQGLNRLRPTGEMDVFAMPNGLPNDSVRGICQDRGGHIWIGSNNGLLWFDWYWQRDFYAYNTKYGLSDPFVSAIREDRDGNLWVGTYSGLNRFHDGRFYNQLDSEGLPFGKINTLFVDREGDLWVGSQEGLIRLTAERFSAYTRQQGLTHNNIMSVLQDHAGSLWIGTWGGGVNLLKDETITHVDLAPAATNELARDLVLSLCECRDGSLWCGADFDGGLSRLHDGKITHYTRRDGLIDAGLSVLHEDATSNLWIGTSRGLCCWRDGRFLTNAVTAGLAGESVRDIAEDRLGALWFATQSGLRCWRGGHLTAFTTADGLPDNAVLALYADQDDALWLGTANGGLVRLSNDRFTTYTTRQGLFSDEIFDILEDDQGCLWCSCSHGIFRVRKGDLNDLDRGNVATVPCMSFGKNDGMESPQCNGAGKPAGWKTQDGHLWFPTGKGLVTVDPQTIKTDGLPPPVLIETIVADGRAVENEPESARRNHIAEPFSFFNAPTAPLRIPPGRGEMEVHYTALSLAAPEKNRFQYKLSEVDADWVDAGVRRVAYYNNLPPGRYQFRVRACNKDGVWNDTGAALSVVLAPHVWQTIWFRTLAVFAVVGGAAGIAVFGARRRMQRQLARLEQQHAVEKERIRIARDMHDQLGAGLTQIGLLGELARRGLQKTGGQPRPETPLDMAPPVAGAGAAPVPAINSICVTARELAQTLDEIVWTVNPRNDTLNKLGVYLAAYAEEFFQATGIRCRLDIPPGLPDVPLSAELRHNFFMTVKEALNNIAKHSRATEAWVRLALTDSAVEMVIEDNGIGLTVGPGGGNGLNNMKARMAEVGGALEISSAPNKGTRLSLRVPLKAIE